MMSTSLAPAATPHRAVWRFNAAIVRRPAPSVVNGLRAQDRGDPDPDVVMREFEAYVAALSGAGLSVTELPPLDEFPDSIFVEDPALVFPEGAIVLRPGNPARLGEAAHLAPVLSERFETVIEMPAPGFADGGDILTTPDCVMIGLSSRTDREGAGALSGALTRLGRQPRIVSTPAGVLHLKSDCSLLDDTTVLSTARLARSGIFEGMRRLIVPEGEEAAANALRVNEVVLLGADFPRTAEMLEREGYRVVRLQTTEIGKVDAGLSCMSLRWFDEKRAPQAGRAA